MSLEYRVLGPIEVWAEGRRLDIGGARQRRLLGALILAGGRPVSADRLLDIVWVGDPSDRARNTLRTYIARARRALEVDGEAPLLTDQNGWRLERPADAVDSARFESLLSGARAMAADPMAALTSIEDALSLWRDDAFVEFRDEDWCAGEAVRLDELRLAAEEERFEAMLGCGLYDDAIGDLQRFTDRHPLRDRSRGQHMVALYRAGRQVDAVRAYQDYRRYLQHEIGVEPSDELRSLEQRIVERDPSLQQLAPDGRRLRGYQLGAAIGQGAFGRIYRAAQPMLGREVAVKVVRPELADDPEFVRRFDGEARLVARLEHPHIVPLFDYWREPGGAYLVMRYLNGGNARQLIETQGPQSVERVARLVEEIGSALATAHAAGVTHRDVKPANILFDDQGNSYLGDFGIALATGSEPEFETEFTGSAMYVSPEQAGQGQATARSDIYAFGAVLFELLTGQTPFRVETPLPELTERKRLGAMPKLTTLRPDLPGELDAVIQRATAPDPARRFATVGDLVVAFRAATEATGSRPSSTLGWAVRNPYKGLAAFDEADTRDFFGREKLVEQLHGAITRSRFVAVVGPSGSGKSSVVRAGLAPHLHERGAYVVAMVPGAQPMDELARALLQIASAAEAGATRAALRAPDDGLIRALDHCLPDPSAELVLILDQFEELFTMADDAARDEFLRAISTAVRDQRPRIRVIATIRADFYDRPLSNDVIRELVQANTVAVTPLGPADLERAITSPAAGVGVTVEPALVAALVADATGASMSLPLVQYELTTLFDGRDGDTLTMSAYSRHGGLGGVIARRADEIFDGYDDGGREDVRRLFGRLVATGDRGDDTRRRVRLSELATIPASLIDAYTNARLLTVDRDPLTRETTVEIAHEALIHEWPRLRLWVDADREGLRTLRHLTTTAAAWEANRRDPGELYRGGRLAAAEEWASSHPGELNPTEQAFLDASVRARDAAEEREWRRVRRLRVLVTSLGVVAVVAIGAGLLALRQSRIADDNAAEAEQRAVENRTSQLVSESSLALVESDPDLAILLALAAHDVSSEISDTPQPGVVAALHEAVQASRLERVIAGGSTEIAVSPDGRTVALDHLPEKNRLATYDIETGDLIAERTFDDPVGGLAYSPDGSLLAMSFCCTDEIRADDLPAMLLLDPASLETVEALNGGVEASSPSWSTDGRRVLNLGWTGVRVWRVGNPDVEQTIPDTDVSSTAVFVPGSNTIAVASVGTLDVIDVDTGETLVRHQVPFEVRALRVSPAGDRAAFIDAAAGVVEVLDLDSGEPFGSIDFPSPESIRFTPDGASLSIAGNADVVRVVSLEHGDVIELRGHGTGVLRQAYTPEGQLLVPMREGGTRVWNLTPAGPRSLGNLSIGGFARGGQTRSKSEMLASVQTGTDEGHIEMLDITNGTSEVVAEFSFVDFRWPVYSPDGGLVAGLSRDEQIPTVIDVETVRQVATLEPCETPRAIDRTNQWILVDVDSFCPDRSPSPGFVELTTGESIASADTDRVFFAALGPPGSVAADVVAYTTWDHVVFRRASTLEVLAEWSIPEDVITFVPEFSPDGSVLAVSSQSRQGIVFDVDAILAGADADEAVRVFPEMHPGPTQRAIPVGDSIVTTGAGTQVRQWDAATGDLLVDVSTNLGEFVQLFALPDGKTLFYADAKGVLRRYLTDPDDLVGLARSRVQRDFTETECLRFFATGNCPT